MFLEKLSAVIIIQYVVFIHTDECQIISRQYWFPDTRQIDRFCFLQISVFVNF